MDKLEDIKSSYSAGDENYCLVPDDIEWLIEQAEMVVKLQEKLNSKIMLINNGKEEEHYVLQEQNKELKGLCLWSARRLKHQQYKDFAYDQFEKITGEKWRDYDDTI